MRYTSANMFRLAHPIDWADVDACFWRQVARCEHGEGCAECCWLWQGWCKDPCFDYGTFSYAQIVESAHRMAVILHDGALIFPSRFFHVCHSCNVKLCVNPAHLRIGSPSDNARDVKYRNRPKHYMTRKRRAEAIEAQNRSRLLSNTLFAAQTGGERCD
jgi:hypothetical protein